MQLPKRSSRLGNGTVFRAGFASCLPAPLCSPQLPVPIAVFFLLYKERMVPCFNSSSHPLLSADELAMETRPTEKDDLSTAVQRPRAAGGELEAPLGSVWGVSRGRKKPYF